MGIDVPVLAWGLGIDRMALMHLGLNDLTRALQLRYRKCTNAEEEIMPKIEVNEKALHHYFGQSPSVDRTGADADHRQG
jgi:phenylalanyl-tRNA synthetase alpha subunit